MVVTPRLLESGNYVMQQEFPTAKKQGIPVLAAEMEPTDRKALERDYPGIPSCVNAQNKSALQQELVNILRNLSLRTKETPQQHYLIGLAYLHGIDVEKNVPVALKLLEQASREGVIDATDKLVYVYGHACGVRQDVDKAEQYQQKLIGQCREAFAAGGSDRERWGKRLLQELQALAQLLMDRGQYAEAIDLCNEMGAVAAELSSRDSTVLRYLGISRMLLADILSNVLEGDQRILPLYQQAVDIFQQALKNKGYHLTEDGILKIGQPDAEDLHVLQSLLACLNNMGDAYVTLGDSTRDAASVLAGEACYQKVHNILISPVVQDRYPAYKEQLANSYLTLGNSQKRRGNHTEALRYYLKAHEINEIRYREAIQTQDVEALDDYARTLQCIGMCDPNPSAQDVKTLKTALAIWQRLADQIPDSLVYREYVEALKPIIWQMEAKVYSSNFHSAPQRSASTSQNYHSPSGPSVKPTSAPKQASAPKPAAAPKPAQRPSAKKKGLPVGGLIAAVLAVLVVIAAGFGISTLFSQSADDPQLHTPQILQTYCGTKKDGTDTILTITECTQDGRVEAVWEFITRKNEYGRIQLSGQITAKKNNGKVTITWNQQTAIRLPDGYSWGEEQQLEISKEYSVAKTGSQTLRAGVTDDRRITAPEDLDKLRNSGGIYFLAADIDLEGKDWKPIENFSGTLIGNGHAIRNMKIRGVREDVGLFAVLKGTVMDLRIEQAQVLSPGGKNVGILCGKLQGVATNVTVSGRIAAAGGEAVGGVIGLVDGTGDVTLTQLQSDASVTGGSYVGGIVGGFKSRYNSENHLSELENRGTVNGNGDYVGGILGGTVSNDVYLYLSKLQNSGKVTGSLYTGGIVGKLHAIIGSYVHESGCAAQITGKAYVGCIAGSITANMDRCTNQGSTLTATGYIEKNKEKYAFVGGFAGSGVGASNCVNQVQIQYTADGLYVGGILGYLDGASHATLSNLENRASISGSGFVGGIIGGFKGQYHSKYELKNLTNSADISGSSDYVGGILGGTVNKDAALYLVKVISSGNISGKSCVGGICGSLMAYGDSSVKQAESTGKIAGSTKTGKICGQTNLKIS
jgi:tetratricopeptide (TPR) repeat protein